MNRAGWQGMGEIWRYKEEDAGGGGLMFEWLWLSTLNPIEVFLVRLL
jgi:hypothetical protein